MRQPQGLAAILRTRKAGREVGLPETRHRDHTVGARTLQEVKPLLEMPSEAGGESGGERT